MNLKGEVFTDHRGTIRFVNDFEFESIRRFYIIMHSDTSVIRAWQGHKIETKYFYVTKGTFLINWIQVDNWENPSNNLYIHSKVISDKESEVLKVSPGHVSGFKALESDSMVIVFSDLNLTDSKKDDYRFPVDMWQMKHG
jgi:dTDP-4-dehydrorhamnose 3,5-epimerase-like enzyme